MQCVVALTQQYGSAYRYERPQHGRYREFHQFGGEVIHCDNDVHDTEVICLCHSILSQLELLPKTKLLINSLGDDDAMKQYRDCLYVLLVLPSDLQRYFSKYADSLSKESQDRFNRGSILRILDSKQAEDQAIVSSAPSITSFLSPDSSKVDFASLSDSQRFERLQDDLESLSIPFQVDSRLVRGLDYYDNLVFEFSSDVGALIVLLSSGSEEQGGGCYSSLAEKIGGAKRIPCIGFSAGLERCLLLSTLQPPSDASGVGVWLLSGCSVDCSGGRRLSSAASNSGSPTGSGSNGQLLECRLFGHIA